MRAELEAIIPDSDAFAELVNLLHRTSFYAIQQAWIKKGIEPVGLVGDPAEIPTTRPLLFSAYDQSVAGDVITYPLVRAHIYINLARLLLDVHEHTPLPEVVAWFAELCERYRATLATLDQPKMDYRFLNTSELKPLIAAEYERRYLEPLATLPLLNQVYSPTQIRLYAQLSQDDMRAYLDAHGLTPHEILALGGIRITPGNTYAVKDYTEAGKPVGHLTHDPVFGELVEVECRKRKLRRLLEE